MSTILRISETIDGGVYSCPIISSVEVFKHSIEVIKRAKPNFNYAIVGGAHPPDKVWKEVWCVANGELIRFSDVVGSHVPATMNPEKISFP